MGTAVDQRRWRVLSACSDVEAALSGSARRVLLDAGHKYTPGQKFAHWEHKGVRLRVEVGPREAERGCCTVARTFNPGSPAHRPLASGISTSGTLRLQALLPYLLPTG